MIAEHQPPAGFFPNEVTVAVSSLEDGNQSFRVKGSTEESPEKDSVIVENRRRFLDGIGLELERTALVYLHYEPGLSYADYAVVTGSDLGKGMAISGGAHFHDGLATGLPDSGLFLPLADCYGGVIYDPIKHKAMVTHLGRHSTNIDGAQKSVQFMQETFDSDPANLLVWLTPGVGPDSYPMDVLPGPDHHNFAEDPRWQRSGMSYIHDGKVYLDLRAFNIAGFQSAGVKTENIAWADIDTATHPDYPSHSRGTDWRFALAVKLEAL